MKYFGFGLHRKHFFLAQALYMILKNLQLTFLGHGAPVICLSVHEILYSLHRLEMSKKYERFLKSFIPYLLQSCGNVSINCISKKKLHQTKEQRLEQPVAYSALHRSTDLMEGCRSSRYKGGTAAQAGSNSFYHLY